MPSPLVRQYLLEASYRESRSSPDPQMVIRGKNAILRQFQGQLDHMKDKWIILDHEATRNEGNQGQRQHCRIHIGGTR